MVNKHAEEVGPHYRSLIFGMLAVGMALPLWWLWRHANTEGLSNTEARLK